MYNLPVMGPYGIERRFEGGRGERPILQLDRGDLRLLLQASVKISAERWLEKHPYSRIAKKISSQYSLDITAGDIVRFVRAINRSTPKE